MKKILILLLAAAMLLAAAGCAEPAPEPEETAMVPFPAEAEPTAAPSQPRESADFSRPSVKMLDLLMEQICDSAEAEGRSYSASQNLLYLQDAGQYPQLAARFALYNERSLGSLQWAMDHQVTQESRCCFQRSDTDVVSIREDWYEYAGGPHPSYGTQGINFDTATGAVLTVRDVVTDLDVLRDLLEEKLREAYPEVPFEDLSGTLSALDPEAMSWTMSYQGMTFYFGQDLLAPYAAGCFEVTLWYEENPALFDPVCFGMPSFGYALQLPVDQPVRADLSPGDGRPDTLLIRGNVLDEYGTCDRMDVTVNGETFAGPECWSYGYEPYLVCLGGDRFFLYAVSEFEDVSRNILVFSLEDSLCTYVGRIANSAFPREPAEGDRYPRQVFNDPGDFELETFLTLLGYRWGRKGYVADLSDGMPCPITPDYLLEETFPLTTKIPLSAWLEEDQEWIRLPSGTCLTPVRTDGESWVEVCTDSGTLCSLPVDSSTWPTQVCGLPASDCFLEEFYSW